MDRRFEAAKAGSEAMTYREAAELWNSLELVTYLDPKDDLDDGIDKVAQFLTGWLKVLTGEDYRPVVPYKTRDRNDASPNA